MVREGFSDVRWEGNDEKATGMQRSGERVLKQEEKRAQLYEDWHEPGDSVSPVFSPQKDKDLLNA